MGSRLGVIVQTESGSEIYYDHWAAQSIGGDIALDGFDATLHRVRQMEPMGVDTPHDWKGAVWIEGTLLIDLRSKTVVWAEESEGLYLPRLINALVGRTWPGWTAIWSPEGTRGTLWAAGVDPASLFTSTAYGTRTMEGASWFGPWDEFEPADAFSAVLEDGELLRWRGEGVLDVIAEQLRPSNAPAQESPCCGTTSRATSDPTRACTSTSESDHCAGGPSWTTIRGLRPSAPSGRGGSLNRWATISSGTSASSSASCEAGGKTSKNAVNFSRKRSTRASARTP